MSVKTYSLKNDGNKKLSANFTVAEFKCNDGSDKILIDTDLVVILQKIRDHFGKPLTLNSAYRSPTYNRKIGGVSNSQHVKGTAADVVVQGVKPELVAQYVEYLMPNKGGIGLYSTFTHVDVRANRSRWKNYGREIGVSGFPGYKENPKPLETVNDIVWSLSERGIIANKALWLKKLAPNSDAYWLAYKCANMTTNILMKSNLSTINDIIWELGERQIITNKTLWLKLLAEDEDLYWLAFKICNCTKNK